MKDQIADAVAKPEPIRVAVSGIEAKPITMNESHNWAAIAKLPPFQMFLVEGKRLPETKDMEQWALTRTRETVDSVGDAALWQAYCEWHKAKGYWPNETPLGKLLPDKES